MFYSHFILAKKGPLATVWMAAHLERKLRKNQVNETNICASVDSILYPDVPIALRLSGHLLVGVVRIYSRKVNYLYQDCNEVLAKIKSAFRSVQVDLPPGATSAPYNTITLPETFEFDDLDEGFQIRVPGAHVTTPDRITLDVWRQEQASGAYTMIYLNKESQRKRFSMPRDFTHAMPYMDEDVLPPFPMDGNVDFDQMDMEIDSPENNVMPDTIPEKETLRSAVEVPQHQLFVDGLEDPERSADVTHGAEGQKGDEMGRPVLEEIPVAGEPPTASEQAQTPAGVRASISGDEEMLTTALGGLSQGFKVISTPPKNLAKEKKKRSRKRKIIFDEYIVLSNDVMKKQLQNTQDICRVRKRVPCTELEVWRAHRRSRLEHIFNEPTFPGLSSVLQEYFNNPDTGKPSKVSFKEPEEAHERNTFDLPPVSNEPPEIEIARHAPSVSDGSLSGGLLSPQIMQEDVERKKEGDSGPHVSEILDIEPVIDLGNFRSREPSTSAFKSPRISVGELEELPVRIPDFGVAEHDGWSEQFQKILEDNHTTAVAQNGAAEAESSRSSKHSSSRFENYGWSTRTRGVAKYLQTMFERHENSDKHLNLSKILFGRRRKEAGRMFFETLVLKSKDYIDVEQEEPYADILLSPTPKLMKAIFEEGSR